MAKRTARKRPKGKITRNGPLAGSTARRETAAKWGSDVDVSSAALYDALSSIARQVQAQELPYRLTIERLRILGTVRARGPICLTHLAEAESISLAASSRAATSLERGGYIQKSRAESDLRTVLLTITRNGERAFLAGIRAFFLNWVRAVENLNSEQFDSYDSLLHRARSKANN